MKTITSKDNSIIKLCSKLSQKKYRDRYGKYLIEGENAIFEAMNYRMEVDYILVCEDFLDKYQEMFEETSSEKMVLITAGIYKDISQTENGQGIMGVVSKKVTETGDIKTMKNKNFVVLDRLQDPGNIGTIIRTADAAGYGAVISMKGTVDVYSPKVVRAAACSLFRMPVVFMDSPEELVEFARAAGKKLVCTCFDTDNYYYDEDLKKNIALIIGNEGNGVSKDLIDSSDVKVKIPMVGTIESLNASVAAGILMYEAMRKERG